jgi:hypothetical protein
MLIGGVAVAGGLATMATGCAATGVSPVSAATLATAPVATAPAVEANVAAADSASSTAKAKVKATASAKAAAAGKSAASAKTALSAAAATSATVATGASPAVGNPKGTASVPAAAKAVSTAHPNHVIGNGKPASCTSAAVVRAVAEGGIIRFNCGPKHVTITMTATAKVVNTSQEVVLDGGGKVTLSGNNKIRILYMNTCDENQIWTSHECMFQQWPLLVVQNLTFINGYSATPQTGTEVYGGGGIFAMGGQLKVVNSLFHHDGCYQWGPDLGGGAIRAYATYRGSPIYITHDTFTNNYCSNGAALSGLHVSYYVYNSIMTGNRAIGYGQNPPLGGYPGGGSGGAIYTDGTSYNLLLDGTVVKNNTATEGGSAVFFAVVASQGTFEIENSTLINPPSGVFQNAPGIYDVVNSASTQPYEVGSTVKNN